MVGTTRALDVREQRVTPPKATAGIWHVATADDAAVAYESGLLEPFGAPRCRAVVERSDGSVAFWLDAAPEAPPWTPAQVGSVARRLGRAQALALADLPQELWLARGRLRRYLELAFDEADVRFAFAQGTAVRLSWLSRGERTAWDATRALLDRLASST